MAPRLLLVLALSLGLLACRERVAIAQSEADLFTMTTQAARSDDGARLTLSLAVAAAKGYKWNKEFPFRLTIEQQEGVKIARTSYNKADVKLTRSDRAASVSLGDSPAPPGEHKVSGKVSFSICDAKVCKVYRNRRVEWSESSKK
jgi:hypothetical protein